LKTPRHSQSGVTLIEVLVSILILSFGMLALGGMLAYAVQLPKLSGYRAAAATIAAGHIERMRANQAGFAANSYDVALNYNGTAAAITAVTPCTYPACTQATLAADDTHITEQALRQELPNGGMRVTQASVGGVFSTTTGDMWVVWDEPTGLATLNAANSDNCPSQVTTVYTNPAPRCLYIRFDL
jgi:type IV pilus assembly protein PilV